MRDCFKLKMIFWKGIVTGRDEWGISVIITANSTTLKQASPATAPPTTVATQEIKLLQLIYARSFPAYGFGI